MKIASRILCYLSAVLVLASLPVCRAQNLSGMAGDVTDASGAALPGATVTLENKTTGIKFTQSTNEIGFYRFAEIPPGQGYDAVFTAKGFATLTVKEIYLTVNNVRTQNASLRVSAQVATVEVTATNSEVTIDTTTSTIGNTFDVVALNNLPVQQRNSPTALFTMQPGVTDSGAVSGARVDQNYVTLDGIDVNDLATGGASQDNTGAGIHDGFSGLIVGGAPVDSIEEFHAGVAGVESSTGGGGQFQLVTKSGTNTFHGNVNEYHRDEDLVANSWFSNNSNPIVPRNHLIQNQFGGNFGGPVIHNKLFFFFDFNDDKIIRGKLVQRTVPLDSLRAGTIGYKAADGTKCYLSPTTTTSCDSQTLPSIQSFDPQGKGVDGTPTVGSSTGTGWLGLIDGRYPHSNNTVTGDGINSGGFGFNAPDGTNETNYVGRGDYNINDNMKLFARFSFVREDATENPNEFAGDPSTNPLVDRSYNFVVGHNWVIGSNKTNRLYIGDTVQKLSFPNLFNPEGSTFFTFSDGIHQALGSSLYLQPGLQARRIPVEMIGDDFSIVSGKHTWEVGGTYKYILAHNTTVTDYNTVLLGLGGNTTSLCGPTPGACGAGNPSLRPSNIGSNAVPWDQAFTFLLARIGSIRSGYNYDNKGTALKQLTGDQRFYKYFQTQLNAQDTWKVTPSLTVNFGLTYQLSTVPYETRGLQTYEPLTFQQYFNARVLQSQLGQTGPGAVPLISYLLGGKANGASPLYPQEYKNLAPHAGFSWNPGFDKKSVFNAGASIAYDRTVIFAIMALQDSYSYLFQQFSSAAYGVHNNPYSSMLTDPRLDSSNKLPVSAIPPAPATPKPPYQPFTQNGVPIGLQNGQDFNETIDPGLRTPYTINYNAGWQRSMPWDMVLKVNYAGRLGRRLLSQADANQVLDFVDPVSGQSYSAAFGAMTTQLRASNGDYTKLTMQPWMENVVTPGLGVASGYANNTQFLGAVQGGYVSNGDFGDFTQAISSSTPYNVGSAAQFSENSFHNNQGFSSYGAMLLTLQKNMSHGLNFDFNYTWSHSIDNISFFANSQGDTGIGGGGLICDEIRPRECRAVSDFDLRNIMSGDATYQLPFGKGKMFLGTTPHWGDEIIGGWSLSGVSSWHSGFPWQTSTGAFVASYSNDAPAIFTGTNRGAIKNKLTKLPGGGVSDFADSSTALAQFGGPVGFNMGPRNSMRGPGFFNADLGLGKTFPIIGERVNAKFRADAFNVLNHPNFQVPSQNVYNGLDSTDITGATFGKISYTVEPDGNLNNGARVLELSLRMEF